MHTHLHLHTHIHTDARRLKLMSTRGHTHIHMHTHTHTHTDARRLKLMSTRGHTHIHMHTHTHTHTQHTHVNRCMSTCASYAHKLTWIAFFPSLSLCHIHTHPPHINIRSLGHTR